MTTFPNIKRKIPHQWKAMATKTKDIQQQVSILPSFFDFTNTGFDSTTNMLHAVLGVQTQKNQHIRK